jgi:hypothetical protein
VICKRRGGCIQCLFIEMEYESRLKMKLKLLRIEKFARKILFILSYLDCNVIVVVHLLKYLCKLQCL